MLHRYETVVKRWPIILTSIIDNVHRLLHDLTIQSQEEGSTAESNSNELAARIKEGKGIIEKISRLKYRMARDHELE